MTLTLLTLAVLGLLALRVPVAFALLIPSLGYLALSDTVSLSLALPRVVATINSFPLVAVPLFLLMGNLANAGGLTDRLYNFAQALLGHVRGSLGYVNVAVSFGFSWMSGTAVADAGAMSRIQIPAMVQRGYDVRFAAGLTGASAIISPVMPPSIPAVIYAVTAGVSLGAMLIAGILPAIIITLALAGTVYWYARHREDLRLPRATRRQLWAAFKPASLGLLAPVILLGGILGGVFTPTEAAGVAAIYVGLVGVLQRGLTPRKFVSAMATAAETTASIMLIVGAASLFTWIVAFERGPAMVASLLLGVSDSQVIFLLLIMAFMLVVGMIVDPASAILIVVPILLPVAEQFGIEPLHFGVIVILNLLIGLLTPPVGLILYVVSSAGDVPFWRVVQGSLPFLIPLGAALILVAFVPAISLALPRLFGF